MKMWIDQINTASALHTLQHQQDTADRRQREREEHEAKLDSFVPLAAQLRSWWLRLTPDEQRGPFRLAAIAGELCGKYRDRPALRDLANTCRAEGWRRLERNYSDGHGYRRWAPPAEWLTETDNT